jgi:molecular chaperone DnaK
MRSSVVLSCSRSSRRVDEDIKSGKEKLMNSAQKLFAKVYEQAQQAGAGAGPNMGGANAGNAGSSKPDDDVVDADFKEV